MSAISGSCVTRVKRVAESLRRTDQKAFQPARCNGCRLKGHQSREVLRRMSERSGNLGFAG